MTHLHHATHTAIITDDHPPRHKAPRHNAPEPTTAPSDVEINGAKLRKLRKLMGDDLKTFATRAGVTFQYISQLERGVRRRVSPPTFARICDALGIEDRQEMILPAAETHQ